MVDNRITVLRKIKRNILRRERLNGGARDINSRRAYNVLVSISGGDDLSIVEKHKDAPSLDEAIDAAWEEEREFLESLRDSDTMQSVKNKAMSSQNIPAMRALMRWQSSQSRGTKRRREGDDETDEPPAIRAAARICDMPMCDEPVDVLEDGSMMACEQENGRVFHYCREHYEGWILRRGTSHFNSKCVGIEPTHPSYGVEFNYNQIAGQSDDSEEIIDLEEPSFPSSDEGLYEESLSDLAERMINESGWDAAVVRATDNGDKDLTLELFKKIQTEEYYGDKPLIEIALFNYELADAARLLWDVFPTLTDGSAEMMSNLNTLALHVFRSNEPDVSKLNEVELLIEKGAVIDENDLNYLLKDALEHEHSIHAQWLIHEGARPLTIRDVEMLMSTFQVIDEYVRSAFDVLDNDAEMITFLSDPDAEASSEDLVRWLLISMYTGNSDHVKQLTDRGAKDAVDELDSDDRDFAKSLMDDDGYSSE